VQRLPRCFNENFPEKLVNGTGQWKGKKIKRVAKRGKNEMQLSCFPNAITLIPLG
jgi:hypothetical protein